MDKKLLNKLPEETEEQYLWRMGHYIGDGLVDSWKDIGDIVNSQLYTDESQYKTADTYRRQISTAKKYYDNVFSPMITNSDSEYDPNIQKQLEALRKERIKIQTLNVERNRIDREEARRELFYEQVHTLAQTIPVPEFNAIQVSEDINETYVLCLADIHAGAKFKSLTNEYSLEIMQDRFDLLSVDIINFIKKHGVKKLIVLGLGDTVQGLIHANDLKINDSSMVVAVVTVVKTIAMFLTKLSQYANIDYAHVGSSNHSQLRLLGTKSNELMDEDVEYIIAHYIKDLCSANTRIHVHTPEAGEWFTKLNIEGYNIIAMHGHQIKNFETILKDLSAKTNEIVDYLIVGHCHTSKEISGYEGVCHDTEVLMCPSFVGCDPYADSIFKGNKPAVKIFGFDDLYGHNESYKIIF